jgi:type I restriction enzyme S subunit
MSEFAQKLDVANVRRFKPYSAYKPSGVEWLGDVPDRWEVKRSDQFVTTERRQLNPGQFAGREVFHYSIPVIQETGTGAVEEGEKIASAKQLIAQTVLLVSKLNPRKATVCIATPQPILTLCSTEFVALQATACDFKFLYYLALSELFRQRLDANVQSVTRSHQRANPEQIYRFWAAWPCLNEQHAIVRFLDKQTSTIDTLIAKKNTLIEKLKEKRSALISRTVTRGLPPDAAVAAGFPPHPPLKHSGLNWLGEVPAHWDVKPLKRACTFIKDGTHQPPARQSSGIPLLSVRNVVGDIFRLLPDDSMISEDDYDELCRSFVVKENDVLLAIVGATMGKVAIVPRMERFHIQRSLAVFRCREESADPRFLAAWLRSSGFQDLLWLSVAFSAQPGIYLGTLKEFPFLAPPASEQVAIAAFLGTEMAKLDVLMANVQSAIERLHEYRTALITAAVTGQIDVRGENQ